MSIPSQPVLLGKGFPYSLPSVGPGSDPSVQAVSPQVTTISHPPGGRLPLLVTIWQLCTYITTHMACAEKRKPSAFPREMLCHSNGTIAHFREPTPNSLKNNVHCHQQTFFNKVLVTLDTSKKAQWFELNIVTAVSSKLSCSPLR